MEQGAIYRNMLNSSNIWKEPVVFTIYLYNSFVDSTPNESPLKSHVFTLNFRRIPYLPHKYYRLAVKTHNLSLDLFTWVWDISDYNKTFLTKSKIS